jgi:hypothetical protein
MDNLRQFVEPGAIVSYGVDFAYLPRRVATYVDIKVLKGAKAADLPVEQPTKFERVINLKTAKALGLTIPQARRWLGSTTCRSWCHRRVRLALSGRQRSAQSVTVLLRVRLDKSEEEHPA